MSATVTGNGAIDFPFRLPPGFAAALGYDGTVPIVGFWWEPAGDELAFDDGCYSVVGANWPVWLGLTQRLDVWEWCEAHGVDLGSSDGRPIHWLVIDRTRHRAVVAPIALARTIVAKQELPS